MGSPAVSSMMSDYADASRLLGKVAQLVRSAMSTARQISPEVVLAANRLHDDVDCLAASLDAAVGYLDQIQSTS